MKHYIGLSGFAMMHPQFPDDRFLQCFHDELQYPGTSILFNFFGRKWDCIEAFVERFSDRPHLLEFHLCFRNPDPDMADYARRITKHMEDIASTNTRVLICPILEDNLSGHDDWYFWAGKVRKHTPYELVRCPLDSFVRGGNYLERHTIEPHFWRRPRRCIANPDGDSVNCRDGMKYFKTHSVRQLKKYLRENSRCTLRQVWYAPLQGLQNCRFFGDPTIPPPPCRDYIITDRAIKKIRRAILACQ